MEAAIYLAVCLLRSLQTSCCQQVALQCHLILTVGSDRLGKKVKQKTTTLKSQQLPVLRQNADIFTATRLTLPQFYLEPEASRDVGAVTLRTDDDLCKSLLKIRPRGENQPGSDSNPAHCMVSEMWRRPKILHLSKPRQWRDDEVSIYVKWFKPKNSDGLTNTGEGADRAALFLIWRNVGD